MSAAGLHRWWSVTIITAVIGALGLSDWLRPVGLIDGVEPMRLVNIALTLVLA